MWFCQGKRGFEIRRWTWSLCWLGAICFPATAAEPVDFAAKVQPVLETYCVGCHCEKKHEGGLRLDTYLLALQGGDSGKSIIPGKPAESLLLQRMSLTADDEELMPPKRNGGPLPKEVVAALSQWIKEGATWPKDLSLKQRERRDSTDETNDTLELVQEIHKLIVKTAAAEKTKPADYSAKVPLTNAPYHMVAIAGGEFLMGNGVPACERRSPTTRTRIQIDSPSSPGSTTRISPQILTSARPKRNGRRSKGRRSKCKLPHSGWGSMK
jgi:hypothetical protein